MNTFVNYYLFYYYSNFKGYVAGIQSPTYIKIKDDMLFKFILSNESKKVTFLVWGQDMINKYIKDITSNRVCMKKNFLFTFDLIV